MVMEIVLVCVWVRQRKAALRTVQSAQSGVSPTRIVTPPTTLLCWLRVLRWWRVGRFAWVPVQL